MSEATNFWRSGFGDDYISRNSSTELLRNKEWMFRRGLEKMQFSAPTRVIEFGANIGLNILALSRIDTFAMCEFSAVEVNAVACEQLRQLKGVNVYETSMLQPVERDWGDGYCLSMSVGLLIHVPPSDLPAAYSALYDSSKRYIFVAEYHNPTPVEVVYRGHTGKLWKRDFAAEMLDRYPDLKVADYGFRWSRDPHAPQDDLFWALLSKGQA
jgi:pseudaminic acid biosynthesis-associated methylase